MRTIYAPTFVPTSTLYGPTVFLAGSIEMGRAEDWQARLTASLTHLNGTIFNPRRPDWDPSWVQSKDNPQFRQQVEWELSHLGRVDLVALYLAPGTMSPISLMELGLHVHRDIIVCCPPGFWRKGNVDITCERHGIPVYDDFDMFTGAVIMALGK